MLRSAEQQTNSREKAQKTQKRKTNLPQRHRGHEGRTQRKNLASIPRGPGYQNNCFPISVASVSVVKSFLFCAFCAFLRLFPTPISYPIHRDRLSADLPES